MVGAQLYSGAVRWEPTFTQGLYGGSPVLLGGCTMGAQFYSGAVRWEPVVTRGLHGGSPMLLGAALWEPSVTRGCTVGTQCYSGAVRWEPSVTRGLCSGNFVLLGGWRKPSAILWSVRVQCYMMVRGQCYLQWGRGRWGPRIIDCSLSASKQTSNELPVFFGRSDFYHQCSFSVIGPNLSRLLPRQDQSTQISVLEKAFNLVLSSVDRRCLS